MPPASVQQAPALPFPSPSTIQPSSLSRLTLSDKLLLSQAVHHIGTSPPDWGRVSSILLSHPLIKTRSRLEQAQKAGITLGRVFGSRECERAWVALMRQYNLVLQPGEKDPSLEPESDASGAQGTGTRTKEARGLPPRMDRGSQLALAQYLYAERIREIQDTIKAKETEFKLLVEEIDKLNAGTLDDKLLDEMERLDAQREQEAIAAAAAQAASSSVSHDEEGNATGNGTATSAENALRSSRDVSVSSTATSTPVKQKENEVSTKTNSAPLTPIKDVQASRKNSADLSKASASPSEERSKSVNASDSRVETSSKTDQINEDAAIANATRKVAGSDLSAAADKPTATAPQDKEEEGDTEARVEASITVNGTTNKRKHDGEGDTDGVGASPEKRTRVTEDGSAHEEVQDDLDENADETNELSGEPAKDEDVEMDDEEEDEANEDEGATADMQVDKDNVDADENAEEPDDDEAEGSHKRPEPRRTRRSARNVSTADEDAATPVSEGAGAAAKNTRVEALRSREASGTSAEPDDSAETTITDEADVPRNSGSRGRTSLSPVSARRGKSASRPGTAQRRSARGSSTGVGGVGGGANDESAAGSDVERERTTTANAAEKASSKDRKMEKVLMLLLGEVSNHTHGNLFHAPIKETDAPDYFQLIRHPLDLKTIKGRIKDGKISTSTQLRRALMQMFANSLIYNRPGSDIHRMALEMRDAAEEMLDRFEQTQLSASYARR